MKKAYDERQMAVRHRAGDRALVFLSLLVLLNGAWVQWRGPWATPLSQALLVVALAGAVYGVAVAWSDAFFEPGRDPRTSLAVCAFLSILGLIGFVMWGTSESGWLGDQAVVWLAQLVLYVPLGLTLAARWMLDRQRKVGQE
ncbi:hypothetical protein ATK17_3712 [Branchiibius hedensis]|uniref:Uncharacterized protein n=1 Tax=Branchiibius hedensis TaxID=672460 RepID=A0A2Y8ZVC3_9MICO|nr:hypothetical protein [Branchiibius hedensis]PWJ27510.1 hypothetical protein ATK17_3712 [Branchiibius hedensis]SSA36320.1 hypothetical protein SAMN04489750_3712 [Branchiibius hedensis]